MTFKKAKQANKGMTVVYSGGSSVVVKKNGTLAWRNNNPGNLISGPFTKGRGAIGSNKGFAATRSTGLKMGGLTALLQAAGIKNNQRAATV